MAQSGYPRRRSESHVVPARMAPSPKKGTGIVGNVFFLSYLQRLRRSRRCATTVPATFLPLMTRMPVFFEQIMCRDSNRPVRSYVWNVLQLCTATADASDWGAWLP